MSLTFDSYYGYLGFHRWENGCFKLFLKAWIKFHILKQFEVVFSMKLFIKKTVWFSFPCTNGNEDIKINVFVSASYPLCAAACLASPISCHESFDCFQIRLTN